MKRVTVTLTDDEVAHLRALWARWGAHPMTRFLPAPVRSVIDKVVNELGVK